MTSRSIMPEETPSTTNLSSSIEQLMGLMGCECVYKERGLVLHAKLVATKITHDRIELTFKRLPSQGFTQRPLHTFACNCVREYLSFRRNRICSSLLGIEVFFKESDVNALVGFMVTMPDAKSFISKLRDYRKD